MKENKKLETRNKKHRSSGWNTICPNNRQPKRNNRDNRNRIEGIERDS